jgi:hypothetical protein
MNVRIFQIKSGETKNPTSVGFFENILMGVLQIRIRILVKYAANFALLPLLSSGNSNLHGM